MASSLAGRCLRRGLAARNGAGLVQTHVSCAASSKLAPAPRTIRARRHASTDAAASVSSTATTAGSGAATATTNEGGTAGKLFFTSLCVATFGLGAWQTQRYFEKVDMVQKREDDFGAEALASYDAWRAWKTGEGGIGAKSYRRVNIKGRFQHDREVLVGPRGPPPGALAESGPNSGRGGGGGMSSSAQGYWVVTPLVVSDGEEGGAVGVSSDSSAEDATPKKGWFGRRWGKKSEACATDAGKDVPQLATDSNEDRDIVWINRGWIPRHYINNQNERLASWDQPRGTVQLMAMESSTDTPGTFTPPSRFDSKSSTGGATVQKLLWLDRTAMEELTSCPNDCHPPLFVEINEDSKDGAVRFPAKPPRECVGEFKVTPEVHAGYAATWFGLSGAGMVMTRKLLTRGR